MAVKNGPVEEQTKVWGRFTFVSKDPAEDSDHIYFQKSVTTIGRNKNRCDIVINKLFISSVHCVVELEENLNGTEPTVKLLDKSRNGIWVNSDRIGQGSFRKLSHGYTIHFTKPGSTPPGVTPMAYKFEFLNFPDFHPVSTIEVDHKAQDANMMDETIETPIPEDPHSPSVKKRKREDESASVSIVTLEIEKKLKNAETQLQEAEAQIAALNEMEQQKQVKVETLEQENLSLMSKLEAATAENLRLKTDLATKTQNFECKIKDTTQKNDLILKENSQLKKEMADKEQDLELQIKETVATRLESHREMMKQEMADKLKESTKKYQQKVEAEHYEQRLELSEKMAAFEDDNKILQEMLATKENQLAESKNMVADLQKKLQTTNEKLASLSEKEATYEMKIAELEQKVMAADSEIAGIIAAAKENVAAAEEKAAIAVVNANSGEEKERLELLHAMESLRSDLQTYRVELADKQENKTGTAEALMGSATAERIAQDDDPQVAHTRLTTALNLFRELQTLSHQGMSVLTGTTSSKLGDLHLLSIASDKSQNVPSHTINAIQQDVNNDRNDLEKNGTEGNKLEGDTGNKHITICASAEPKTSPSKLKHAKKKTSKQPAPLSAAIETSAASAIASMSKDQSDKELISEGCDMLE